MATLHLIERHNQLLDVWHAEGVRGLRIAHLDFHCDMKGLLVDRRSQRAWVLASGRRPIHQGNFLTHAIADGTVRGVRWIHDEPGGRRHDIGTVAYTTDLSSPFRGLRRSPESVPLAYQEIAFQSWAGLAEGEFLDVCWDLFACLAYPLGDLAERIAEGTESFFRRDFTAPPAGLALCYSPEYSHPTRDAFEKFAEQLAGHFGATIVRHPDTTLAPPASSWGVRQRSELWLHRHGIF